MILSILIFQSFQKDSRINKKLMAEDSFTYISSISENTEYSLSLKNSDFATNKTLLLQIVGTLVRYNSNGSHEPFLAKEWHTNSDNTVWKFYFKNGLVTEDNVDISPENYKKSFLRNLMYLKSELGDVLVFEGLIGIDKFFNRKSSDIEGINCDNEKIVFKFKEPTLGVLESLSFPYFGFFSEAALKCVHQDECKKLPSSSTFRIENFSKRNVILKIRDNNISNIPHTVNFKIIKKEELEHFNSKEMTIIRKKGKVDLGLKGYKSFEGYPSILSFVLLSTSSNSFFAESNNRESFKKILRQKLKEKDVSMVNSFYASNNINKLHAKRDSGSELKPNKNEIILHTHASSSLGEKSVVLNSISEILKEFNLKIKLYSDFAPKYKKFDDENEYDLKFESVNTGGVSDIPVIEMMFLSKLGVQFGDKSGAIKNLISEYKNKLISLAEFSSKFEDIISSENIVIPVAHYGDSYLLSEDLNPENISSVMDDIFMEKIAL
jgi:ABC-type oligopeptide transport system substrate-binding subunit